MGMLNRKGKSQNRTPNLGCEIRLRSETNNFRNRNFTVRNIYFP